MPTEFQGLTHLGALLAGTYLLHSTVFLVVAWFGLSALGRRSPTMREQVWRWSAILPLVTSGFVVLTGGSWAAWNCAVTVRTPYSAISSNSRPTDADLQRIAIDEAVPFPEHSAAGVDPLITIETSESSVSSFVENALEVDEEAAATGRVEYRMPADISQLEDEAIAIPETQRVLRSAGDRADVLAGTIGPLTLVFWTIVLWVILGTFRVAVQAVQTVRCAARWRDIGTGPVATILDGIRSDRGVTRPVRLMMSAESNQPAAFGLWRQTIVLPRGLKEELDSSQLRAVLAHELAHLVRGDVRWMWCGRVLTAVIGWQPLNFLAVRRWREASEQLCDEWAIASDVDRLTLARCLALIAERRMSRVAPVASLAVVGRRSRLGARIHRLTMGHDPDRWESPGRRRVLGVLIGAFGLLLASAGPHIVWALPEAGAPALATIAPHAERAPRENLPELPMITTDLESPDLAWEQEFPGQAVQNPSRRDSSGQNVSAELEELYRDLQHALDLLEEIEPDPEIAAIVEKIRTRITLIDQRPSSTGHAIPLEEFP